MAKRAPSEIDVAPVVLPLKKLQSKGASAGSHRMSLGGFVTIPNGSTTALTALDIGEEFAAEVTIGTETFELIIDTGS